MYGSDVTVTLPNPLFFSWGGWCRGSQGWLGDRNLSALGTSVSLLPATYSPLEPLGPQKPCLTPLGVKMEEGLRTSCCCAFSLAGWTGRTRHQPLLIPPLESLSGEQLQALSVGLGRKTVIRLLAATLSRSLRAALAVSPDKCPTREESPSAGVKRPQLEMQWLTFLRVRAGPPPCLPSWNSSLSGSSDVTLSSF